MIKSKKTPRNFDKPKQYVLNQNVTFIRKTILVCIFLYSIFGLLDYVLYPEHIKEFYIIRFGVVVPYLIFLFFMSYSKIFYKGFQVLLLLLYFLAGTGIVLMVYFIGGDNYYTNGLFLVFAIGFYLIRLKLHNSVIAYISVIGIFVLIELLSMRMTPEEIFVNAFFYITFGIIGIFGGFFNERYIKEQYKYEVKVQNEKDLLNQKINAQLVQINQQLEEINSVHKDTITALAHLAESRDKLTAEHLKRVGELSLLLAQSLQNDFYIKNNHNKEQILESIELASILHDIGKVAISDEILNKPSKLTKEEFEIIKEHSMIGARTLESMGFKSATSDFVKMGIDVAKYHHEKWDGTGYPEGLCGKDIPLSARIVAVIDVYDALISERPYKKKINKMRSLQILKEGSGSHFDPEIIDVFINLAVNSEDINLFSK